MKSVLTCFFVAVLGFLFNTQSFAQISKLEFAKSARTGNPEFLNFVNDEFNKRVAIITQFENYCKVHVVESGFKIIAEKDIQVKEKSSFKGGYFLKDSLILYFLIDTYKETSISEVTYSLSGNAIVLRSFDVNLYNENILDVFVKQQLLYVFTLKNDNKAFGLYGFEKCQRKSNIGYNFSDKVITKENKPPLHSFALLGSGRPRLLIDVFDPDPFFALPAERKSYIATDSIYILDNFNAGVTNVYSLCIKNNGCNFRKIYNTEWPDKSVVSKYSDQNSFFFERKLFYVAFTGDSLKLIINDFNSGKCLKSFVSSRNDTIYFKSTPIVRNGESESERIFSRNIKTSEFFNKIKKGGLFVYVKKLEKKLEIVIGAQLLAEKYGSARSRLLATPYGNISLVEPSPTNDRTDMGNIERRNKYLIRQIFEFSCIVNADNLSLADMGENQFSSLSTRKSMFIEDKKRSALEFIYVPVAGKDYFLNYNEGKKIFDVYEMN